MGVTSTLPETNIATENMPSQKGTGRPTIHFEVLYILDSGRVSQQKVRDWRIKCHEIMKRRSVFLGELHRFSLFWGGFTRMVI